MQITASVEQAHFPHYKKSENCSAKQWPLGRVRLGIVAASDDSTLPRAPGTLDEIKQQGAVAQQKHAVSNNEGYVRVPQQQMFKALFPESNQNMCHENGLGDDWQCSRHARRLVE